MIFHTMTQRVVLGLLGTVMYLGGLGLPASAMQAKKHNLELAYEHSKYTYKEPHMAYPIKDYGHKNGVSIIYTMRSVLSSGYNEEDPSFASLEGRYMGRDVTYKGWMSYSDGTVEPASAGGLKDYYFEAALKLGRVYQLSQSFGLWPYLGIGWRQLRNHLEDMGEGGYQRTSTYIYLPIGTDLKYTLNDRVTLSVNGQFDILLHGNQYSRMTDLEMFMDDASNRQSQGYGIRASAKASVDLGKIGVFMEPFWRYWHIQNSSVETFYYDRDPSNPGLDLWEPFNTTHEYGIRAGIMF
ncbi:MAG: hypothetical protein IJ876_07605 [Elusimicrobiaceae bacterium]|nr:hypothetical protein [Elusimicrobiaceae bacterium]